MTSYQPDSDVSGRYYTASEKGGGGGATPPGSGGGNRFAPYARRLRKVGTIVLIASVMVGIFYLVFNNNLPSINRATDYQPPLVTEVFSDDLERIGEFYTQYRYLTPLGEIPPLVRKAFIAAEDSRFFEHSGIDYAGILRALVKNIQSGGVKQGGSTITQQVAKSLLLSPERTLARKAKEALLAFRIEKQLNKEEILYLYLNQIYLGHGAYGVAAGARAYFNKELNELDLSEIALLAGMPTAPSRDNPFVSPERARNRRAYVLRMMEELGFISGSERKQADEAPFQLDGSAKELNATAAPYFTEHIRRYIADKYGEKKLYEGGMKVYTTVSQPMQRAAQDAVRWNLHELDKRQGYRGPSQHLNDEEIKAYVQQWSVKYAEAEKVRAATPLPKPYSGDESYRAEKIPALVTEIDNAKGRVKILTTDDQGWIPLELMNWARKPDVDVAMEEARLTQPSQALKRGDMVQVRYADLGTSFTDVPKEKITALQKKYLGERIFALEQEPEVQGAILAVNSANGFVMSMVGGYDFKKSEFNRAVQAKRQPGSAFKPIIYAAAIDKGYTPATVILDAPVVFDDPVNDTIWRPKNYSGTFQGDILFRTALIESRNVVTVKILQDIGLDYVIDYATKLGITSPLTRDSTLALGSTALTPLELTRAYTAFGNTGVVRQEIFIKKILDRDGNVLERQTNDDPAVDISVLVQDAKDEMRGSTIEPVEVNADTGGAATDTAIADNKNTKGSSTKLRVRRPGQVISEETAFITTHLLNEVVTYGTGYRARALNRPAAGKTGTTNEHIDAWFVGFTPDLLTTAWVGFDEKKSLGKLETGAKAASPMWLKFMLSAVEDRPKRVFPVPGGITFVKIDPQSGKLANDKTEKAVVEAFKDGTQPTEEAAKNSGATKDFFLEE